MDDTRIEREKYLPRMRDIQNQYFRFRFGTPKGLYDTLQYYIMDNVIRTNDYKTFIKITTAIQLRAEKYLILNGAFHPLHK